MLKKDGVVENEMLIVLMRCYQQMDVSFARERGEGCWRFFMDPDFAVIYFYVIITRTTSYTTNPS
jgi:hypothetical protein